MYFIQFHAIANTFTFTFTRAFDSRIVPNTANDSDRLYYLDQHLDGEPKKLIGGCLYMDASVGYREARELLQKEYGDPYKVSMAYVEKVLSWLIIKSEDNIGLKSLYLFLVQCSQAMRSISHMDVLNHAPNLQAIVHKMPVYLQNKWREYATKTIQKRGVVLFEDLVQFMRNASETANDPIVSREAMKKSEEQKPKQQKYHNVKQVPQKHNSGVFATNVQHDTSSKATTPTQNEKSSKPDYKR